MSATTVDMTFTIPARRVCPRCDGRRVLVLRFLDRTINWACPMCNPRSAK